MNTDKFKKVKFTTSLKIKNKDKKMKKIGKTFLTFLKYM